MRELDYYNVGDSYGGSQDWFPGFWMHVGGCGALTACDACICLARYRGMRWLYPFDPDEVTREDYLRFGRMMQAHLSPRPTGINKTALFMEGFSNYMATRPGPPAALSSVEGDEDVFAAAAAIKRQIDAGVIVPYLLLRHTDREFSDYNWHWFIVNGYDDSDGGFRIKTATFGQWKWFDFIRMWDTGYDQKGGFVIINTDMTSNRL